MKEKIIRLNKFVDNVCGSCFFFEATGFFFLLAVFIASHFGTALFEASSTWVPSEISYKKQTTINYFTSSKKALVAHCTEREICKHDPSKKVVQRSCSQGDSELNPMWVTGFVDGEGCFTVSVNKSQELKVGWQVKPSFKIGLHEKDKAVLEGIKNFLRVGHVTRQGPKAVQLRVQSIKELKVILEHFYKFPLISKKRADFLLLMQVIEIMERGEHLTIEGLHKIVAIKASMNLGLSDKLKVAFPDVVPVERPLVELPQTIDPQWLAGFTDAEGSFLIKVTPSKTKVGQRVQLIFQLTQHSRDEKLMRSLIELLKSGKIHKDRDSYKFCVTKFDDIVNKIIPFFKKYPILGVKALDFADFCKAAELMKNKAHLTKDGLEEIRKIKAGMNTGREWG